MLMPCAEPRRKTENDTAVLLFLCDNRVMKLIKKIIKNRHTFLMWFWIAMIPVTLIWLKESVLWVALMSLYANIESSAAAKAAENE